MRLVAELLAENEDLEARLHGAIELLDSADCGDCMGTRTNPSTGQPCTWCARIDALRPPEAEQPAGNDDDFLSMKPEGR
jgi:hypothetical protein